MKIWKGQRIQKLAAVLLATAMLLGLSACKGGTTQSGDVLTQKKTQQGRTQVSVLVKYAFSIHGFEQAVEEEFPDIDLVQVGNFTANMGVAEYEARLEHDDLPDMVMTWPLDVGKEYWDERLLDLSGMECTNRYNISMLNDIAQDGKLYYLPGPSQVRGIVYNKTLFAENGWQVPADYEGFLALCKTIEASGVRALQLGLGNSEVLDTAFIGYNYGNFFSRPQDAQALEDYNNGQGSFGDWFGPALDVFQEMIDVGVWKPDDLNITYSQREKMLFTRQCAMIEDSVLMARMGQEQTGTTDEFALMPFFGPGENNDWARLYMVCYIGLNKHLAESANRGKLALVQKLLNYISTPAGQTALASDTGAMFSSLTEATPPDIPEIQDLLKSLNRGRYAVFPTLRNAQSALRDGLGQMVAGHATKEDVIAQVDQQNATPSQNIASPLVGTAAKDFSLAETGCYLADVIQRWSGCEVALFLDNGKDGLSNGKGVGGRIYQGDITEADVTRILPDLKAGDTGTLWKGTITGADLLTTLESAITVDNGQGGWFYYTAGLAVTLDPTAAVGDRVKKVTMGDGRALDPGAIYSIAITDGSVPESALTTCEKTNVAMRDILTKAIQLAGTISPEVG